MDGLLVLFCGLLGLAIGSFLNVVIWRVPQRVSVVRPPSHCPNCKTQIRPLDNIPVLSWLVLRGRCRHCDEPIPVRYPLVEAGNGVLFAAVAARFGASWELPAYLVLTAALVAISMIDLDTKTIPNRINYPLIGAALALLGLAAAAEGEWWRYGRAILGGLAFFAFLFLVFFIYPKGMGFGDVRLSFSLGLYLGWLGWGQVYLGGFLGFLLGALISIGMIKAAGWKAARKQALPFGPFLALGTLLTIFWGDPILRWYTGA